MENDVLLALKDIVERLEAIEEFIAVLQEERELLELSADDYRADND